MKITILGLIETFIVMLIGTIIGASISCVTVHPRFIDKDLVLYKNDFIIKTKYKDSDFNFFSIKFMSIQGRIVGTCNSKIKEIFIDPSFWHKSTRLTKKALMFHEFGHCICHQDHYTKTRKDDCPISLMNKTLPGLRCLKKHWDSYMEDFLKRCK